MNTPEHVEAARRGFREENAQYLTVILEGRYTESYLKKLGSSAPKFTAEEMAIIGSKLDFVGLNIYQPTWARAAADGPDGYAIVPPPASYPAMFSSWLTVGPEAIYWAPRFARELWNVPAIYITENGASSSDTVTPDGHVYDTDRVMYLRNYLMQLQRTIQDGSPVKGYFLWSLLDNFEWADGYDKRFGITYVDFATQKRTPKLSLLVLQRDHQEQLRSVMPAQRATNPGAPFMRSLIAHEWAIAQKRGLIFPCFERNTSSVFSEKPFPPCPRAVPVMV